MWRNKDICLIKCWLIWARWKKNKCKDGSPMIKTLVPTIRVGQLETITTTMVTTITMGTRANKPSLCSKFKIINSSSSNTSNNLCNLKTTTNKLWCIFNNSNNNNNNNNKLIQFVKAKRMEDLLLTNKQWVVIPLRTNVLLQVKVQTNNRLKTTTQTMWTPILPAVAIQITRLQQVNLLLVTLSSPLHSKQRAQLFKQRHQIQICTNLCQLSKPINRTPMHPQRPTPTLMRIMPTTISLACLQQWVHASQIRIV